MHTTEDLIWDICELIEREIPLPENAETAPAAEAIAEQLIYPLRERIAELEA